MKFLKYKYYGKHRFREEWHESSEAYKRHLETIYPTLPESFRAFDAYNNRYVLHDSILERIVLTPSKVLIVELRTLRLEYFGVIRSSDTQTLQAGDYWLYDELDKGPGATFEHRVCFSGGELQVTASEIRVFSEILRRYVIPPEPPPPPPILFLNKRQHRNRG